MRAYLFIIFLTLLFVGCSQEESKKREQGIQVEKKVPKSSDKNEALICLDEDTKITCKLMTKRIDQKRSVHFEWISPNGKDNRKRTITLPANHASVFDARYKQGRAKGRWRVEVELAGEKVSTTFNL